MSAPASALILQTSPEHKYLLYFVFVKFMIDLKSIHIVDQSKTIAEDDGNG